MQSYPHQFCRCTSRKKTWKKATEQEKENYIQAKMTHNLSSIFVIQAKKIRAFLNSLGAGSLRILFVCDGSFCNTICMTMKIAGADILARCRKNAVLCFEANDEGRKKYSAKKFTPESVRQNESIAYRVGSFFYGGKQREIRYKEVMNVLWQKVTKLLRLRLIVIAPIPYVKGGRRNAENPDTF